MAVPSSGQLRLNGDINLEINGTGTGTNVSLNALSSEAGFTAPNGMKEFYGYVDAVLPNAGDISNVTGIGTSSMTVNGYITNDGGATITERGFYFGTNSNCTSNPKYSVAGTVGNFSRTFTGLSSSTTYYMRTYAINSVGEDVGDRCVAVATTAPNVSTLISSYGSVSASDPSGGNDGTCATNNQCKTAKRARQGFTKSPSVAIGFWLWSPNQTSNSVPVQNMTFSYGTAYTTGVICFGPTGTGAGVGFYERYTASGYGTQHVHYVTITCV